MESAFRLRRPAWRVPALSFADVRQAPDAITAEHATLAQRLELCLRLIVCGPEWGPARSDYAKACRIRCGDPAVRRLDRECQNGLAVIDKGPKGRGTGQ
jgi:hypothetical protein